MPQVLGTRRFARSVGMLTIAVLFAIASSLAAQQQPIDGWATRLYRELDSVGLDPNLVFQIRDVSLDREDLHINLQDGTIGFTRAVNGHITGAIFQGEGEVLLIPPDRVERWSLNSFTGSAILEERFTSAYFRFNDETFDELKSALQPADEVTPFISRWEPVAVSLAHLISLRVGQTIVNGTTFSADAAATYTRDPSDRVLAARVTGIRSGVFDIVYDSKAHEQIIAGRLAQAQGNWHFDLWTSFPARSRRNAALAKRENRTNSTTITTQTGAESFPSDPVQIEQYKMRVQVSLPTTLEVDAVLRLQTNAPSGRVLNFELSRFLRVSQVTMGDKPVEFIQNEALKGSGLSKRGNDVVTVILPAALQAGQRIELHFLYKGDVLKDAGGGLMYVGAHGDWYPCRGLAMSNFDLEFRYPPSWTLIATGKRTTSTEQPEREAQAEQVSRWISERPIPFAGFNLGRYDKAAAKAGDVLVEAYASHGVESEMKQQQTVLVFPSVRPGGRSQAEIIDAPAPSPASNAERVAKEAARTIEFYTQRIGSYPYSSLSLTQMPGPDSQSWPGLIYLSSYVFLTPEERSTARISKFGNLMYQRVMVQHETGHQWWGDLLIWKSYREQWIVEALSNYCALVKLESEDELKFREIMNQYRQDLLTKNNAGTEFTDAGPVTLGVRLNSSRFPNAYETISYGRGTWLFHMLRTMLLSPGPTESGTLAATHASADELFFRALRKLRERFEGKEITTRDLQRVFEEELPPQLYFENRKSLDWFFDGWVNGTSIPRFTLGDVKVTSKPAGTMVTGKILLKDAAEGLVTSVPIYAVGHGNPVLAGRVFVEGPETYFRLRVPAGTKKILVDPHQTLLSRQ